MADRKPLTDPRTGRPLAPMEQPGYYRGFSTMSQKKYWDATTRSTVEKRVQETKPLRFFSPEEAMCMAAVVDRIVPQDDRVPERRIPILPAIDERLYTNTMDGYRYEDMPPDQDAYRIAVRAFNAMARALHDKEFAELETTEQETILQSLHDNKPLAAKGLWGQMNLARFWSILLSDCVSGYYAHPWAWDEVGFGGPAYPRGYMRLEHGEPEPWEKDESRYEWVAPADTISDEPQGEPGHGDHVPHPGMEGTH